MNSLRHRSTLLAAASTAVLALSLTACQDDADAKPATGTTASAAADAARGQATGSTPTTGAAGSKGSDGAAGASESTGSAAATGSSDSAGASGSGTAGEQASAAAPACTAKDVRITAATQGGPPYTHLVLTAKNTSGHTCRLPGFPHVQFLESHKQDVPAVGRSRPATPVVLHAGEPAYAAVKLSDGGTDEDNEPVSAFSITLEGDSTVIAVTAPGSGGIAVDPAKALTGYWTPELRNGADDF
ncbi:DUF4232 domain-containing protein [Streptomyces sp. SP2-10]|uniref:DUF4232 domain-containing protein n=1 Tax=Streptomyces sp. SP2-10 TaxID=2873385 RepID=UPI001CA6666D|nr:DUF4232 domain-containing protein [Streptomyces sp. SP2-10]MBY8843646.1 DUF4232 domain-containing protein [Streptomyces sp. SP2-10]